ncbi:MAG: hypothetical protein IJC74_02160 [Clostridia bacterium]|nr:hypothetical protein [Clostridia bacterium]
MLAQSGAGKIEYIGNNPYTYKVSNDIIEVTEMLQQGEFSVKNSSSGALKFDISALNSNIKEAYIKVYCSSVKNGGNIVSLNGEQQSVNFNNKYYYFDVTNALKSATNYLETSISYVSGGEAVFNGARTRLVVIPEGSAAEVIKDDSSEYSKTVEAKFNASSTSYLSFATRGIDDLSGFTPLTSLSNRDDFGGNSNKSYTATGKYYITKNENGRSVFVDPDGNEFYGIGISNVSQGSTANELNGIYSKYPSLGNEEALNQWGADTADELKNQLGFTESGWSSYNKLTASSDRTKNLGQIITVNLLSNYLKKKVQEDPSLKLSADGNALSCGSNILYVFERDFESYCETYMSSLKKSLPNEKYILGFASDNELPGIHKMLDAYLALDNTIAINKIPYEVACKWYANYMGTSNIDTSGITDIMRESFKEFVYDRYYKVVSKSIRKYFPDTLYFGVRNKYSSYESSGIMKATGRYCDVISINYYRVWTPESYTLTEIAEWSGKPFMITEFYAKGEDTGFGNTDGWGWTCKTQKDRAAFYQNYALKLLECKDCVGFNWFKYRDDDDSNKGLYDMNLNIYSDLADGIKEITYNVYELMDYFDEE